MKEFIPKKLPLLQDIETTKVLKKTIQANRALAKLNGVARIIPNSAILINSLVLQEAKDSSAIENITTTFINIQLFTMLKKSLLLPI